MFQILLATFLLIKCFFFFFWLPGVVLNKERAALNTFHYIGIDKKKKKWGGRTQNLSFLFALQTMYHNLLMNEVSRIIVIFGTLFFLTWKKSQFFAKRVVVKLEQNCWNTKNTF